MTYPREAAWGERARSAAASVTGPYDAGSVSATLRAGGATSGVSIGAVAGLRMKRVFGPAATYGGFVIFRMRCFNERVDFGFGIKKMNRRFGRSGRIARLTVKTWVPMKRAALLESGP